MRGWWCSHRYDEVPLVDVRIQQPEIAMLRFLLLAVLLACVSAFVPPATLAQRSVVGRAASVEMGGPMGVDVKSLKDEP